MATERHVSHQYRYCSAGTFHEDQKMIQQAMEQDYKRDADNFLGLIWAQDSLDETFKPETWYKSNPLLYLDSQKQVLMEGLQDKRHRCPRIP